MSDDLKERLRYCRDHFQDNLAGNAADRIATLEAALSAAIGNMMNAAFDLGGGTKKAFAIGQLNQAVKRARDALGTVDPESGR